MEPTYYVTRTGTKAHLDPYCANVRKPNMSKISAKRAADMDKCQNCNTAKTAEILSR
jgi:hypothetical protein